MLKNKDVLFTPEEVGVDRTDIIEKRYSSFKKAVIVQTLCNILPAKNKIFAINTKYFYIPYNAKQIYLYHEKMGKGTITQRSQKEFFSLLFSFFKIRKKLKKEYKQLLKDWQTEKPTFTSLPFWEKYLGLKQED